MIRDGNHFIWMDGNKWVLIDGPWYDRLNQYRDMLAVRLICPHEISYSRIDGNPIPPIQPLDYVIWTRIKWTPGASKELLRYLSPVNAPKWESVAYLENRVKIGWMFENGIVPAYINKRG